LATLASLVSVSILGFLSLVLRVRTAGSALVADLAASLMLWRLVSAPSTSCSDPRSVGVAGGGGMSATPLVGTGSGVGKEEEWFVVQMISIGEKADELVVVGDKMVVGAEVGGGNS
jgi:hypothetical protein